MAKRAGGRTSGRASAAGGTAVKERRRAAPPTRSDGRMRMSGPPPRGEDHVSLLDLGSPPATALPDVDMDTQSHTGIVPSRGHPDRGFLIPSYAKRGALKQVNGPYGPIFHWDGPTFRRSSPRARVPTTPPRRGTGAMPSTTRSRSSTSPRAKRGSRTPSRRRSAARTRPCGGSSATCRSRCSRTFQKSRGCLKSGSARAR